MFDRYHNLHKGESCLVLGNGPSLKDVPNAYLKKHTTFGTNRIYLKFIPDYYVCVNELVIDQFKEEIDALACTKFIRERTRVTKAQQLHLVETEMFSFAPTKWLYDGHNVTFVCLELAFFMGFTTVYLLGVDHRYEFKGQPNEVLYMKDGDPNHFSSDYFKGAKWQAPDLAVSEEAYIMAKEAYESNGRRIINMTPGSALHVFETTEAEWVR